MINAFTPNNKINQSITLKTKKSTVRNNINKFYSLTPQFSLINLTQNGILKHSRTKNIIPLNFFPTNLEENTKCLFEKYKKRHPDDDSQDIVQYDEDISADDDPFFDKLYSLENVFTINNKIITNHYSNINNNIAIKRKLFNNNNLNNNSLVQRICTLQFQANENGKNKKLKKSEIIDNENKNIKKKKYINYKNNEISEEIKGKNNDKNNLKDILKLNEFNESIKMKNSVIEKNKMFRKKNLNKDNQDDIINDIEKETNKSKSNNKENQQDINNIINNNSINNNNNNKKIIHSNTNIYTKIQKLIPQKARKFQTKEINQEKKAYIKNNHQAKLSNIEPSSFKEINNNYYFYKNQKGNTSHLFVRHFSNKPQQIYVKRNRNNNIFPSLKERILNTVKDEKERNTYNYNKNLHNEILSSDKLTKNNHITYVIKTTTKKENNQPKKKDFFTRIYNNTPIRSIYCHNDYEDQRNSNHNIFFVNVSSNKKEDEKKLSFNKDKYDCYFKKNSIYKGNFCNQIKEIRNKRQVVHGHQNNSLSERKIETAFSGNKNKTAIINLKNNKAFNLDSENLVY